VNLNMSAGIPREVTRDDASARVTHPAPTGEVVGERDSKWRVPSGCHRRSIVKSACHSLPAQVVPA